jgi:hypothetical protein
LPRGNYWRSKMCSSPRTGRNIDLHVLLMLKMRISQHLRHPFVMQPSY